MTNHELKTWPEFFKPLLDERKPFEVRLNDRNFKEGDTLLLREWSPPKGYSGRVILVKVTYILYAGFGLKEGWVIMGIRQLGCPSPP